MPGIALGTRVWPRKNTQKSLPSQACLLVGKTDHKQDSEWIKYVCYIMMVISAVEQNKAGNGAMECCGIREKGWLAVLSRVARKASPRRVYLGKVLRK